MNNAIEIENLKKNFGSLQAVQGIQFDVRQARSLACSSKRGGKSTTISMLAACSRQLTATRE